MMIHPSEQTQQHRLYTNWVRNTKTEWLDILKKADSDTLKQSLIKEFESTYQKLACIATDIPIFGELASKLAYAIRGTQIQEVNAKGGKTPDINWNQDYAFILIGGNAMNRGYTVEGLTVTYMPRSVGVGNVDTIQQRARFFGYKRSYLNYCKIYLSTESKSAYEDYVQHEEDMRSRLEQHKASGELLDNWYREVFLPNHLNLTRNNVLYDELTRSQLGAGWFFTKAPHKANIPKNQEIASNFIQNIQLNVFTVKNQEYEKKSILFVLEQLLSKLVYKSKTDRSGLNNLKNLLKKYSDENPTELSRIYLLGSLEKPRKRTLKKGEIGKLFEGRRSNYDGDVTLKQNVGVSFHIHIVNVFDEKDQLVAESVPVIAVYMPIDQTIATISQTYQDIKS